MEAFNLSLDHTDEQILTCDTSDAALELAAAEDGNNLGNYTFGGCTGLSTCPA
jgi:hypothetical protein